jgi:hypothetical protein
VLLGEDGTAQRTIPVERFDFGIPGRVYNPKYAPTDPVWISFEASRENNRTLFVANLRTLEKFEITPPAAQGESNDSFMPKPGRSEAYNAQVSWAPVEIDGEQWFAFVGTVNGNQDIYVGNLAHPGVTYRLTSHEGVDDSPAWSPDGKTLAFIGRRTKGADLYLIRNMTKVLSGLETRSSGVTTEEDPARLELFSGENGEEAFPSWSPDGGYLVYTMLNQAGSDLMVRSLRTRRAVRVAGSQERILRDGVISPNGNRIAYFSAPATRFGVTNLVIADLYLGYTEDLVRAKERYSRENVEALGNVRASDRMGPLWVSSGQLVFVNESLGAAETINWLDFSGENDDVPALVRYRVRSPGTAAVDLGELDFPDGVSDPGQILVSVQEGQHFTLLSGYRPPPPAYPLIATVAPTVLHYLGDAREATSSLGLETGIRLLLSDQFSMSASLGFGNLEGSDRDANGDLRTFVTRIWYLTAGPGYQVLHAGNINLNVLAGGGICNIDSKNEQTAGISFVYYPELELDYLIGESSRLSLSGRYLLLTSDADGLRNRQDSDGFLIVRFGFAVSFR